MESTADTPESMKKKRAESHALELFTSGKSYVEVVQALLAGGLSGPDAREIAAQTEVNNARLISYSYLKWMVLSLTVGILAMVASYLSMRAAKGSGTVYFTCIRFGLLCFAASFISMIGWLKYRFMTKKREY